MIKAVFFDLFFTLILPDYGEENTEFDILNLTRQEWEKYAEDAELYRERALGLVKADREIIDKIVEKLPLEVSDIQKEQLLFVRTLRMKSALQNVSEKILDVLKRVKGQGILLGLISNADVIDCKHWKDSPLYSLFDDAVFSCNVGILKPNRQIYELAMEHLNVLPEECLFVGDGGSAELFGAKSVGMKTVFSEVLEVKSEENRNKIIKYADYHISDITELLKCVVIEEC